MDDDHREDGDIGEQQEGSRIDEHPAGDQEKERECQLSPAEAESRREMEPCGEGVEDPCRGGGTEYDQGEGKPEDEGHVVLVEDTVPPEHHPDLVEGGLNAVEEVRPGAGAGQGAENEDHQPPGDHRVPAHEAGGDGQRTRHEEQERGGEMVVALPQGDGASHHEGRRPCGGGPCGVPCVPSVGPDDPEDHPLPHHDVQVPDGTVADQYLGDNGHEKEDGGKEKDVPFTHPIPRKPLR